MNNFHDLDIKSNLTESEGKGDVSGVHNFCEPVKEECDVVENKDIGLSENEEIDEYKFDTKNAKIFHSGKDGISEFFQHSDLNTSVKSEDPEVGIESSCARRTGEKTDVFEDEIEENKCFIQQYLDKDEKLWGSIDTISSKQNDTIECSQYTTFAENTQLGIGIQSGCDEITNRETNVSESEDSKCFVHEYLDEEGKICNSIDTISLKKESTERELHEEELLEKEDAEANTCELCVSSTRDTKRCNLKCHIGSVHIKVEEEKNHNRCLCDYNALSSGTLMRHIDSVYRAEKKHNCHLNSDVCAHKTDLKDYSDTMHGESKKHKCNLCAYSAPSNSKLQRHVNGVHFGDREENKHKCLLCDYSSVERSRLSRHIDSVHLKVKKHKCHLCDYSSAESSNVKRHVDLIHLKVKKHKCDLCDDSSAQRCELNHHVDSDLKVKKHKCHLCEYRSASSAGLNRHIDSVHLKVKKHKCHLCNYSTANSGNLACHINSVHLKEKKHKCHLCQFRTAYSRDLKCHINSVHLKEKKHKCQFCNYSTAYKFSLKLHIDSIHLKVKREKKPNAERELSEKEAVEANACKPSDYNTRATKLCNIGSVHIKVEGGTKFNCYLCDYSALSSKTLLRHINNGHRGEKKRKFHGESEKHKCDLCAYSAPTKSYLQRHNKRVHLGVKEEKKHKCHLCDYISTHITNLKCHIDGVHLKVKKHKCHLCEYCTAYNDNLKRHINTVHLKVVKGKKQKCYFCNYSSTRSTYLKRHLDSVHPKEKNTSITGAAIDVF